MKSILKSLILVLVLLPLAPARPESESSQYFKQADQYYDQQKWKEAVAAYTKVIELSPNNYAAYYNRALAYRNNDDNLKAIADFTKVIELKPSMLDAYLNRGACYSEQSEYQKAIDDFTKLISLDPKNGNAYLNRGISYRLKFSIDNMTYQLFSGRKDPSPLLDSALADFTTAIELNIPKKAAAYEERGEAYALKGDLANAADDCKKAEELDKSQTCDQNTKDKIASKTQQPAAAPAKTVSADDIKNAQKLAEAGKVHFDIYESDECDDCAAQLEMALKNFNNAIALNPNLAAAYEGRSKCYLYKGDLEKFKADYSKYEELSGQAGAKNSGPGQQPAPAPSPQVTPSPPAAGKTASQLFDEGKGYYDKHDYDSAIKSFNLAVLGDPAKSEYYYYLALSYYYKGDQDRAIANYSQAIDKDPKFSAAYTARGWSYLVKKQYNLARADFNQAIALDPKDDQAYNNRGASYGREGDKESAAKDYKKALEINPKNADALYNLGSYYEDKGDAKKAKKYLDQACELKSSYCKK